MSDTERVLAEIKKRREQRNISQTKMGEMLGLSKDGYYRIESGTNGMSLEYLTKICTILDLSVDEALFPSASQTKSMLQQLTFRLENIGISLVEIMPYIEALLETFRARKNE